MNRLMRTQNTPRLACIVSFAFIVLGGLATAPAAAPFTNDIASLSFSSPEYRVKENGVFANITVVRSDYTNSSVSVNFSTVGGTATAGVNYFPANGVLSFARGEVARTFSVPIYDNCVVEDDRTVLLKLDHVDGEASLRWPYVATLTIVEADGTLVLPAGQALISESGPVNGYIDPGETVSLQFGFRNAAGTNTGDLVATLLETNGVLRPSAPQSYGSLAVHGPVASRPFRFTADARDGQTISATFALADGQAPTRIARVDFVVGKRTTTYSNYGPILINESGGATPYPSTIEVNGLVGVVAGTTVTLNGLRHSKPEDLHALLVSPGGQKCYLMGKAGGGFGAEGVTLTIDDSAAVPLPNSQLVSGNYRPTSYAIHAPPFPYPAPLETPDFPYGTNLASFNNSNPNGNWSLFVLDDARENSGIVSNGWILQLTTVAEIIGNADVGLAAFSTPSTVFSKSNVTLTLLVTNFGPADSSSVSVSNTLPSGAVLISGETAHGTITTNELGVLVWNIGPLTNGSFASATVVVSPRMVGSLTNRASVWSSTRDPNPEDDTVIIPISVLSPAASLVLRLVGQPDPVAIGGTLDYLITVSHQGPCTATSLRIADVLPPGVILLSSSTPYYRLDGNTLTFTNLADLANGSQLSLAISVKTAVAGTLTNYAFCQSDAPDPLKADNLSVVRTEVLSLALAATHSANSIALSWSAVLPALLERAEGLVAPVSWKVVTNTPTTVNGQSTVTLPIENDSGFFRLRL